jgi:hypothetical protein
MTAKPAKRAGRPRKKKPGKRKPARVPSPLNLTSLKASPQLLATLHHVSLHQKLQDWIIRFFRAQADASKIQLDKPLPTPLDIPDEMISLIAGLREAIRTDDTWGIDVTRFVLNGQELAAAMHGKHLYNIVQFIFARANAAVRR